MKIEKNVEGKIDASDVKYWFWKEGVGLFATPIHSVQDVIAAILVYLDVDIEHQPQMKFVKKEGGK